MGLFNFLRPKQEETPQSRAPEPRLKIKLIRGWVPCENGKGPVTYVREGSKDSGALQFSTATYLKGEIPNPTEDVLLKLCTTLCKSVKNATILSSKTATCSFGKYATLAVEGTEPLRFQVWVISNMKDFILITLTNMSQPDPAEIEEANSIALLTEFR